MERWYGRNSAGNLVYVYPTHTVAIYEFRIYEFQQNVETYSANAALALADFCSDKINGLGMDVNSDSLREAIDFCNLNNNTIGLAILQKASVESWLDTLRSYANCWVAKRGDEVYLIPNTAGAPVTTITEDIIVEGTISIERASVKDVPTAVGVTYTDTTNWPWTTPQEMVYHPQLETGQIEYRESVIRMPGFHDEAQARAYAIQRLNYFSLTDLKVSLVIFDEGLRLRIGDIVLVTHVWGLKDKLMRIIAIVVIAEGRYRLDMEEYDEAMYSGVVTITPSYPDTTFALPTAVPAISGIEVNEDNPGQLTVQINVQTAMYPYPYRVRVQVLQGGVVVEQLVSRGDRLEIPRPAGEYTVQARLELLWGGAEYLGEWAELGAMINNVGSAEIT
jgi:hypothetical protein